MQLLFFVNRNSVIPGVTKRDGTQVSAPVWLEDDGYLGRKAKIWADRTPAVRDLLNEKTLGCRTNDLATFKMLFPDHFQTTTEAPFENAILQIQSSCQAPNEILLIYHKRASASAIRQKTLGLSNYVSAFTNFTVRHVSSTGAVQLLVRPAYGPPVTISRWIVGLIGNLAF